MARFLKYFYMLSVQDESVGADPEWMQAVYRPIACPRCKHILPENAGPIDVDIVTIPVGPLANVGFPVSVKLLRTDLFGELQAHMPDFHFGLVRKRGLRIDHYVSSVAGDGAHLKEYADQHSLHGPCAGCGRTLERRVVGNKWFKQSDIGGRLVFSGVGGGGTYVAESLVDRLSAELRRELKLWPVDVRDE